MIIPQSDFKLYKDVGWNNDYKHTLWFSNIAQQISYFERKRAYVFDRLTYVRQTGEVSIEGSADNYYDCNYCSFLNAGYGEKRFYAFVTGVNYINDNTTLITFEVDLIQTWLFDLQIGKCFVDREHVSDDTIGKHTVPEGIPFGDLVTLTFANYSMNPIAVLRYAKEGVVGREEFVNNIYDPLTTVATSDSGALRDALRDVQEAPERIAMFKMGVGDNNQTLGMGRTATIFKFAGDEYTPVNKKLYTYPYTCITVDDYGTNAQTYKWEDFDDPLSVTFALNSGSEPYPYARIVPQNYKGMLSATNYQLVKTDFPDCPYIIDNFRAWISSVGAKQSIAMDVAVKQNTVANLSDFVGNLTSGAGAVGNLAQGNVGGAISSAASAEGGRIMRIANRELREYQLEAQQRSNAVDQEYAWTHGTSAGGQIGGGNIGWITGDIGWRVTSQCIKPEYARIIDDFFTRFGYKVNRYKVPNLFSRGVFNYVKTVDSNIGGNVPTYVSNAVSKIFDAGITIWHSDQIGNYSAENYITGMEGSE